MTGQVLPEVWSVGEASSAVREALASLALPEGYRASLGGQEETIRENRRVLATVVGLAVFLVLAVMAIQYESLVNPLVIMGAMPLAVAVIGGLTVSTALTLFVVPALYLVLTNGAERLSAWATGGAEGRPV